MDLTVTKKSSNEVILGGIEKPAVFELEFENNGASGDFTFYNLVGFSISPEKIHLDNGEKKTVNLEIFPYGDFKIRGFYNFKYYIKNSNSEIEEALMMKVIDLKDAFEVGSNVIDPDSSTIDVYVFNKENFNFDDLEVKLSSNFFEIEKDFSLGPYEKKVFSVDIDKEDVKKLTAGYYTIDSEITFEEKVAKVSGLIKFAEKDVLTTTDKNFGFIINTVTIRNENEGNVPAVAEFSVEKNIISRLFTSFNVEPNLVERKGFGVKYTWDKELKPGEILEVVAKTNWTIPFIMIALIIIIFVYAKKSARGDLILRKKVQFVRAKGGEFALKVSIFVQANQYVENVHLIDRLPPLVKVHERFGAYSPSRIDEKLKRIEWNFDRLENGEVRSVSYVVYSKVGVLGRFALPCATAIFETAGKIKEVVSNRTFFVAEQRRGDEND